MRLIDTVVLIGYLNPGDREHRPSALHLAKIASEEDVFVPTLTLVEADLVMKIKGYSRSERETSWRALESKIPSSKIVTHSVSSIYSASQLQEQGMDYFDSLITSLALETSSTVVTTDKEIATAVKTEW